MGEYLLEWRRQNTCNLLSNLSADESDDGDEMNTGHGECEKNSMFYTTTQIKLPDINFESFPFAIEPSLPSHGASDKHVTVVYTIRNKTRFSILDLTCTLDENEFFSISGNKLVSLKYRLYVQNGNRIPIICHYSKGTHSNNAK